MHYLLLKKHNQPIHTNKTHLYNNAPTKPTSLYCDKQPQTFLKYVTVRQDAMRAEARQCATLIMFSLQDSFRIKCTKSHTNKRLYPHCLPLNPMYHKKKQNKKIVPKRTHLSLRKSALLPFTHATI